MPGSEYQRFIESMKISFEQWHDGIGYDVQALAGMTPEKEMGPRRTPNLARPLSLAGHHLRASLSLSACGHDQRRLAARASSRFTGRTAPVRAAWNVGS
jgi:hypothetical protein